MLTHRQIWTGVDRLAQRCGLSVSGLAKAAGLDPTTFNKSKRASPDGSKPRWPSTESLSKALGAVGVGFEEFAAMAAGRAAPGRVVPLIGFAQAGSSGFFDDAGFPAGAGWEAVNFPGVEDENAYALEISGDSMAPVYRDGDRIVVSPNAQPRRGDRVVVKTADGEVMAKELRRRTAETLELISLNPAYPDRTLRFDEIDWIARVVWASQ